MESGRRRRAYTGILFDSPAGDGYGDQFRQRDRDGAPAQVIADGAGVAVLPELVRPGESGGFYTWDAP
jgi:hypothetical protein